METEMAISVSIMAIDQKTVWKVRILDAQKKRQRPTGDATR
jgi:hypothetical protein